MHPHIHNNMHGSQVVYTGFMQDQGISIVKDKAREKEMVQDLLTFRAKSQEFLTHAFSHGPQFATAMKNAFEKIMNSNGSRPAELLAKYVGSMLQDGGLGKGLSHDELETKLDDAIIIFRYIQGRDVFEQFYKDGLARRLLLKRSSSMEAEKEMISKLKQECGSAYTSKLEGMVRDLSTSEDVMNFFSSSVAGAGHEVLSICVLTTGQWPKFEEHIELVPRNLAMHLDAFSKFYRQKFHGRSISWSFRHSSCTLDASLPSGRYSVIVSFYQAIVLLMFSGRSREEMMSYRQIREETTIKEDELKRVLQSLACSKTRLLRKDPKGREVGDSDGFCINHTFRHKSKRFRVNQIQSVQTEVEKTATEERILVERVHHVDAAVVRIMKTRKSVLHTHLVHEVFRQTRFQLKGSEVKKRIEGLISQDYIRRDEENANLYHYIA
jgi:cullin 4